MHQISTQEAEQKLHTVRDKGLSTEEANQRLKKFGANSIQQEKELNGWVIFFRQFKSPIVILLILAATMSFLSSEWLDGFAILIVLLINAVIGFLMERQAHRSMRALKDLTRTYAKVVRDSRLMNVPSEDVVPGDLLFFEAGDMVMADARIIQATQFQVNESALTGESVPVDKNTSTLPNDTPLAERANMVYRGTFITKGNAKAIVAATGMSTELGKIATMVQRAEQSSTPIEKKLEQFGKKLIGVTLLLVAIIFVAGILKGIGVLEMLGTVIALSVASIPEGLPIVATLALAHGMLKMAKRNVIVKKLAAVETLGGTTVICTDKTGTLTENRIEVSQLVTPDFNYELKMERSLSFDLVLRAAVLCNTAEVHQEGDTYKEVGDPVETGLLKFALREGIDIAALRNQFPKIAEEPFSSETKIMATLHRAEKNAIVLAKGATEELLKRCTRILMHDQEQPLTEEGKKAWLQKADELAFLGLKVLAFGYTYTDERQIHAKHDLVFSGLTGLIDPPRKDVPGAIKECKSAGISVVMITGDHPTTAKNIALTLGIIDSEKASAIHGSAMKNFEDLTPDEKKQWKQAHVFARVSPKQKLDLIAVLQEDRNIVAMTGDGVNDAPALKKADIGIAMGIRGTQVAQEVSDMVLKDDAFTSIVVAVRQGRIIFENIRKFLIYLLSGNLSEILVISTASLIGLGFQLIPLQILFINLITDVFPALALGLSEGYPELMKRAPRNPESPIITNKNWYSIILYCIVITACTVGAVFFNHYFVHANEEWNAHLGNNILFLTLISAQLLHVFNMAERTANFFRSDVFRNKYVWYGLLISVFLTALIYFFEITKEAFNLYPLELRDVLTVVMFAGLSLILILALRKSKVIY